MRFNQNYDPSQNSDSERNTDSICEIENLMDLPKSEIKEIYSKSESIRKMLKSIPEAELNDPLLVFLGFQALQIEELQKSLVKTQDAILKIVNHLEN